MVSLHLEDAATTNGETIGDGIIHLSIPNAKLMHRFYEPLQLLAILNADRGSGEVDLPADPQSREARMIWRRFLDDMSWLCDNKHGGETVSAVAAQSLSEGTKFWLASRYERSFDHLKWVLTKLKAIGGSTDEAALGIGLAIAEKSILFSKDKVKNYLKFLKVAYSKARDELATRIETQPIDLSKLNTVRSSRTVDGAATDIYAEDLFIEIESLICIKGDHLSSCHAAHQFKQRKKLMHLLRLHGSAEDRSPWSSVWHFIGRLGSWFGKCQQLALAIYQFPQLLDGATCEFLALPKEVKLPIDHSKADLSSALKRMLPAGEQQVVVSLYEQLSGIRLFDIPGVFRENITKDGLTGRVHAEVFLLEHFYLHKFQFLMREKYVGCSKPSCYCCSLYMRYHPWNVVMRPAHNNVFVKWVPPLISRLEEEPVRKHNLDIMNSMNAYIRRDTREEIDQRLPRRERGPDSTTGIDSYAVHTQ